MNLEWPSPVAAARKAQGGLIESGVEPSPFFGGVSESDLRSWTALRWILGSSSQVRAVSDAIRGYATPAAAHTMYEVCQCSTPLECFPPNTRMNQTPTPPPLSVPLAMQCAPCRATDDGSCIKATMLICKPLGEV